MLKFDGTVELKVREGTFYDWISLVVYQKNYQKKEGKVINKIQFDNGATFATTTYYL